MASTLIDSLTSLITPDIISKAASQFGESETAMARAVPTGIPTVLAGMLGKASDSSAMESIFNLIKDPANDGSALSNLSGLLTGGGGSALAGLGGKFLTLLFGDRLGSIAGALGQSFGVRSSSASSILGFIAPVVMAFLGNRARTEGLNASGLSSLLLSQKDSILSALPPGVSNLLGVARPAAPVTAVPERMRRSPVARLWPLLILGLLAIWLLSRRSEIRRPRPAADSITRVVLVKRNVCGTDINVAENGIESGLIGFLQDKNRPVDETTWFDFDRLTFEPNSANLRPESSEQLGNVATILKCFPAAKVKIGGYTDNTGDAAANLKLSQARADSVDKQLFAMGVAAERMTPEGYGAEHPIADNSTEEGRARNRRIAMRVTEK